MLGAFWVFLALYHNNPNFRFVVGLWPTPEAHNLGLVFLREITSVSPSRGDKARLSRCTRSKKEIKFCMGKSEHASGNITL